MLSMLRIEDISNDVSVIVVGEAKTLGADVEAEIQDIWDAEAAKPGRPLFNGQVFSVTSRSAHRIEGHFVEYRRLITQNMRPELFRVLGVRPLGVSGILCCADGLVFGRRNPGMTQEPGMWELVPSGSVDTQFVTDGGRIDLAAQIGLELSEEIGVPEATIRNITPVCLVEDDASHVCDIGLTISCDLSGGEVMAAHEALPGNEYTEITIVSESDIPFYTNYLGDTLIEASRLFLVQQDFTSRTEKIGSLTAIPRRSSSLPVASSSATSGRTAS